MPSIRRALISVSDKTGVIEFAKGLHAQGVEILSTGGTAKHLRDAGIDVIDVSDYTGFPEILDGRVKTLHPKIHGGLLGVRADANHRCDMKANGIEPIDLVVVNLYPFEEAIAAPHCTLSHAIENIDIGGPTMLRAAAKNHQDVAVVVDPADYKVVIDEMKTSHGDLSSVTTFRLAQKVFALTARYDAAIATYLSTYDGVEKRVELPKTYAVVFEQLQPLRYGENPHQRAAFYRDIVVTGEPCITKARQLHGKELSYNNIMDADGAIETIKEFADTPFAAVIVKHANPCGVATSAQSLVHAFMAARKCDPTSAFGGIVAVNRLLDEATARVLCETFFEVIIAPQFESGAMKLLMGKKNIRLLEVAGLGSPDKWCGLTLRKVTGGLLLQDRDLSCERVTEAKVVTKRRPTDAEWLGLDFSWRVAKHVKSNAIVFASQDSTLGIGAGQMSRVDASRIAAMKWGDAGQKTATVVLASDAFFPFRDGVDAAATAGATAVIQPGGSVRDNEVITAADEHGLAMVFTGIRHFHH